jgi:hypothetical protein
MDACIYVNSLIEPEWKYKETAGSKSNQEALTVTSSTLDLLVSRSRYYDRVLGEARDDILELKG